MNILYLDVASHAGTLACVTKEKTVAIETIDHRIDDAELVKRIESIIGKAGWQYKDLTHIACATGPGGFTSLRVGVAAANALSWSLKIPSAEVRLWEVYEKREKRKDEREKLKTESGNIWLHSTKKTHVFMKSGKDIEPICMTLEELEKRLVVSGKRLVKSWIGELIQEHQEFVAKLGLTPAPVADLSAVLPSLLSNLPYSPNTTLLPWYGRGW